jgi:hypothetical protein
MAIPAVSSSNQAAATLASTATQNLRQNSDTQKTDSSRINTPGAAPASERSTTDVQENQRAQAPQRSLNTQGQTVGATINTFA